MTQAQFNALVENDIRALRAKADINQPLVSPENVATCIIEELAATEIAFGVYGVEAEQKHDAVLITLENGQRFKISVEAI